LPENGDGIYVLFTQHTPCGLTINENADPDVKSDLLLLPFAAFARQILNQFTVPNQIDKYPAL
jgi:thiamine phosphate synthase YjbQ (UPF0047 family)